MTWQPQSPPTVSSDQPPVVVFRSIVRQRLIDAVPGWLLEETPTQIVTATVPGAQILHLARPRSKNLADVALGRERRVLSTWHTNRVVWLARFDAAHALGHFWDHATGRFIGYYVNLQAPIVRSPFGIDSRDHVLDVVIDPSGAWHWKDEDEFEEAIQLGLFTDSEAQQIRAEGERVIATLPTLLPTGWECWQPNPAWSLHSLRLPPEIQRGA